MKLRSNVLVETNELFNARVDFEFEVSVEEMVELFKENRTQLDKKELLENIKQYKEAFKEMIDVDFIKEIGCSVRAVQDEAAEVVKAYEKYDEEFDISHEDKTSRREERQAKKEAKSKK